MPKNAVRSALLFGLTPPQVANDLGLTYATFDHTTFDYVSLRCPLTVKPVTVKPVTVKPVTVKLLSHHSVNGRM